jgi:hypothetical protein
LSLTSTEQNESVTAIPLTTTTSTTTNTTSPSAAPIDSASPATTPSRHLIRLPWPPTPRQPQPIDTATTIHLPAQALAQQPPIDTTTTIHLPVQTVSQQQISSSPADHVYHPQPPTPFINNASLNRFLHR